MKKNIISIFQPKSRLQSKKMKTILVFLFAFAIISTASCTCWEDWSRCSEWSSAFSGILWQKCPQRCICAGHETGTCVEVYNTCSLLPTNYKVSQCRCSGVRKGPKPSWCGF